MLYQIILATLCRNGLHGDVDVVCHEAEAVDAAVELLNGILQNQIKPGALLTTANYKLNFFQKGIVRLL